MKKHPPHVVLLQYFDQQLGELQKEILEGHLLECGQCAQVVEDLKRMKQLHHISSSKFQMSSQLKTKIMKQAQLALAANKTVQTANDLIIKKPPFNILDYIPHTGIPVAAGLVLTIMILRPVFFPKTQYSIFSDHQSVGQAKEYFFQEDVLLPNREILFTSGDNNE